MNTPIFVPKPAGAVPDKAPPRAAVPRPAVDAVTLSGRTPRISAGVFCDSPAAERALQSAMADRRLSRVTASVTAGGIEAAIVYCSAAPTPDLLILETTATGEAILSGLDRLSGLCAANTKLIVIGRPNDITLYRRMIAKGVSDYLVGPVDSLQAIAAVLGLYPNGTATRPGRVIAFLGAKGGVGASTIAQNTAFCIGQDRSGPVMLADLDLQFGTAALNLNLTPAAGFSEQAMDPDRLDQAVLERTLILSGKYLHVLPASGRMQEIAPPDPAAVEKLLDLARQTFPVVVLDLPHLQSPWVKAVLAAVDDLVIVATPDLACLRNAKCLLDIFRAARPNDPAPRVVLNQVGIARRAGLSAAEFASSLGVEITTRIAFEPQAFAKAAADGRLIAESAPGSPAGRALADLAREFDGRTPRDAHTAPRTRSFLRLPWRSDGGSGTK